METVSNSYRYAGYYQDAESGLYYLQSRYYNPRIARFLTEDTASSKIRVLQRELNGKKTVNVDTGTANAFISQDSSVRHALKKYVKGKNMVMTAAAAERFNNIVKGVGGVLEQSRAARYLK